MDWSDNRPLESLPFGYEHPAAERPAVVERVRAMLASAGVKVADDIAKLGCTTLNKLGVTIEDSRFLRLGLAGSGCGMPCFVPLDRYCLVHETIGGLQEGQTALDAEYVAAISRALTTEESIRVRLIEKSRRLKGKDIDRIAGAADMLSGRDREGLMGVAAEADYDHVLRSTDADADIDDEVPADPNHFGWTCPDHEGRPWNCRFCVAAGIVHGEEFEPAFLTVAESDIDGSGHPDDDGVEIEKIETHETVDSRVEKLNALPATRTVELYVRVARWSRRLTME